MLPLKAPRGRKGKGRHMKTQQAGRLKLIEIFLLLFLAAFLATGAMALQAGQELSDKVVRLHVLANSDSEEDQALKLKVRDRILSCAEPLLASAADRQEAEALRVVIGAGEGHNWWCVVFPPLCAAASADVPEAALAAGLSPAQVGLITEENQGYVLKSKLVEFWRDLEGKLD